MFSYQLYQRFRDAAPEFEQLTAFQAGGTQFGVRPSGANQQAKPLRSEFVSGNYFATFGVQALAGRTLTAADDQFTAPPAAMLSYRAWQQEYAANPRMIGTTLILDGHPFTVIGITPPGFYGETLRSDPPQLFLPLHQEPLLIGQELHPRAEKRLAPHHRPPSPRRHDQRPRPPLHRHPAPMAYQ